MGERGVPVLFEMGERGEYSSGKELGVSWKDTFHGFITPVWEIESKMGGCPISAREAMKLVCVV